MKKIMHVSAIAILLLSFNAIPGNRKIFKKLYALEGVWKMKNKKGFICEEWEKMDNNYLQNKGYVIKGADTAINERVALRRTKENIYYTSTVEEQNDKKPIAFKLTSSAGNIFIFENPEHDFPKRIVYHLVSSDSLHAYIDDGIEGTKKVQHFYYSKQNN
jgi:hypothetical protein